MGIAHANRKHKRSVAWFVEDRVDVVSMDALQGERNVCHGKVGSSNVICGKEFCRTVTTEPMLDV
jgi:hypothetical protein